MSNIVGVDIGYSNVKAVAVIDGEVRTALFPSVVGPAARAAYSLGASTEFSTVRDGKAWFVGTDAMRESAYQSGARDPGWIERTEYQVLVDAALGELYRGSAETVVVTGLPVAQYESWWMRLKQTIEGEHVFQRAGRPRQTVRVTRCAVAMQGLGAILDLALDDSGTVQDNVWARGRVAVVDIGGVTINVVVTDALRTAGNWTVSDNLGLLRALDGIAGQIRDEYPGINPSAREVAAWLAAGTFPYRGEYHPVAPYLGQVEMVAEMIAARVSEVIPEPGRLSGLLLAGGGSLLLADHLAPLLSNTFPAIARATDAYGNAQGYLRLGRYLQRQGKL
jgi:hypothetical protein